MRVLIIKLTSMGDLMHAFPALTDAALQYPDIEFDWVVDKAFSEVPLWHQNVKNVIKMAHRQWKKEPIKAYCDGRLPAFYQELNQYDYDVVIDMQANLKSAVVSWLRKSHVHGLDKNSCREKPAHWAYKYQHSVELKQHSVEKLRELMAKALGYEKPETAANYNVNLEHYSLPKLDVELPSKYLMFVHNASWLTKLWPLTSWQGLVEKAVENGYSVLLPCGNEQEYQRAQQIASISEHAYALPRLSLNAVAALMHHSAGAVCSDTGLAHLAALAAKPAVSIYGSTDTLLIGTHGKNQQHIVSDYTCSPCYKRTCPLSESLQGEPLCMEAIDVDSVWSKFQVSLSSQQAPT